MPDIVESAKGVTLPGPHPKSHESSAPPNEKRGAASRAARLLQVDPAFLEHDRQPEPALLVLEEKAFAMSARQAAAQRRRFGDREDRRMRIGPVRDPERIETREQVAPGCQRRTA